MVLNIITYVSSSDSSLVIELVEISNLELYRELISHVSFQ